jgi:2-polyprenyl-3-methyl-5-hydroxy-6-metoxy-1,4-benzoquinol methylase
MFTNFPKQRPPLSPALAAIYAQHYKINRDGASHATSLAQKMERWLHRQVATDVSENAVGKSTLELGAGTLNQLQYEPAVAAYDIVEPFKALYEDSPNLNRVRHIYADITEIPSTQRYERITSVAVLEHVCNLPEVVARSGLLLADNGVFRASIPSEGTLLWMLGWKLTTGVEFKLKYGLDYGELIRHEHVNTAEEIETVLRYYFAEVHYKVFGLSRALSFYQYYECRAPILERCKRDSI